MSLFSLLGMMNPQGGLLGQQPQEQMGYKGVGPPGVPQGGGGIMDRIGGLFNDPRSALLLTIGSSLLESGGPSPTPISTGQALGRALQAGMSSVKEQQALKAAQAKAAQDAMLAQSTISKNYGLRMDLQTGGLVADGSFAITPGKDGNPALLLNKTTGGVTELLYGNPGANDPVVETFYSQLPDGSTARVSRTRSGKFFTTEPDDPEVEKWIGTHGLGPAPTASTVTNIDPTKLGKAPLNKLQTDIITTQKQLDQSRDLVSSFDPKFFTYMGRVEGAISGLKAKAGVQLDTNDSQYLSEFSANAAETADSQNAYIRAITGAQMSFVEAGRILRATPGPDDNPITYLTKLAKTRERLGRINKRNSEFVQDGLVIPEDSTEGGAADKLFNSRPADLSEKSVTNAVTYREGDRTVIRFNDISVGNAGEVLGIDPQTGERFAVPAWSGQ